MLTIKQNIFEQMLRQAKEQSPIEACGILAGRAQMVEKFYPMSNTDNSNDHFMMDPAEQFAVIKDIRQSGLEMLAVYHSHPQTPARPSQEDIRLALTPNVIYVILSLENPLKPYLKGFLIENKKVSETEVSIV